QGLLDRVEAELEAQLAVLPRAQIARQALAQSRLVRVPTLDAAFDISNAYAPEHLILALREPRPWLDRVEAAGSVFLGDCTPEAPPDAGRGLRVRTRHRARPPDPGPAGAAPVGGRGGAGRRGVPGRLHARGAGRLRRRHQSRAPPWRRGAPLQGGVGGELLKL